MKQIFFLAFTLFLCLEGAGQVIYKRPWKEKQHILSNISKANMGDMYDKFKKYIEAGEVMPEYVPYKAYMVKRTPISDNEYEWQTTPDMSSLRVLTDEDILFVLKTINNPLNFTFGEVLTTVDYYTIYFEGKEGSIMSTLTVTVDKGVRLKDNPFYLGSLNERMGKIWGDWASNLFDKPVSATVADSKQEQIRLYDMFRPYCIYNLYGHCKAIREKEKAYGIQVFSSREVLKAYKEAKQVQKRLKGRTIHIASTRDKNGFTIFKVVVMYFENKAAAEKSLPSIRKIYSDAFIVNNEYG